MPLLQGDAFVKVADATIQPTENPNYSYPVELLGAGQVVQPIRQGYHVLLLPVGQLDTQGNYMLANGLAGNLFRNDFLSVMFEKGVSPLMRALRATQRSRAYDGSEILQIRETLTSRGIDGRGIKIMVCEPGNLARGAIQKNHVKATMAIVQDRNWGVAPGAPVERYSIKARAKPLFLTQDDPELLKRELVRRYSFIYADTSRMLNALRNRHDPALRLINISWGLSRNTCYDNLWKLLHDRKPDGEFRFPHCRQWFLDNAAVASPETQQRYLMGRVDDLLDKHPAVVKSRRAYMEATRKAAESGLIVVVAAGNTHNTTLYAFSSRPGSEMNWLAESPHVISVAACATNQTPGWRENYRISNFSSRGDGRFCNPTITAPGELLPLPSSFGELLPNHVAKGTSYAAPWVAGVIAMMLQLNPNLTFVEVKRRLQHTAVRAAHGVHEQGAGIINPERAVLYDAMVDV